VTTQWKAPSCGATTKNGFPVSQRQRSSCGQKKSVAGALPTGHDTAFCASDSSDSAGGLVEFNENGHVTESEVLNWSVPTAAAHIFLKELLAAVITVERMLKKHPAAATIVLACDNTAACHVLRKMYSSNEHALKMVKRIHRALSARGATLRVVSVRGVDNVADAPSR
jgi:hypothetical protein